LSDEIEEFSINLLYIIHTNLEIQLSLIGVSDYTFTRLQNLIMKNLKNLNYAFVNSFGCGKIRRHIHLKMKQNYSNSYLLNPHNNWR
jgi:hypothetical protein